MDADLARLATLVAHEMRTPLSVVSGYMKMLAGERQGPLTEAQRRSVDGATRASQQLTILAADLSLLAKIARGEVASNRTSVAIAPLLTEVAATHVSSDDHPVRVEADLVEVVVQADAANLRRVLTTLLAAAVRSAPDDATLRLAARRFDTVIAIAIAPVAVVEELIDADPDSLDKVDESTGGLGVGLPLAGALLTLDRGSIRVRTSPQGLGIRLTLPAA